MGSVWSSTVQQWASPVCQSNAYSSLWNCCFEKSIGQQSPLYWPHHTIKWTMSGAALSGELKWCEPGVGDFVSDEARCSAVNPLCRLIITTVCNVPNGTKWYKESLGDGWLSKYPMTQWIIQIVFGRSCFWISKDHCPQSSQKKQTVCLIFYINFTEPNWIRNK